jgi:phosphoesterase RecJ-like protein
VLQQISDPPVPDDLRKFFASHRTFYLVGHVEPDGDCIASAIALGSYLSRAHGAVVRQYNSGPFERREIRRYQDRFSPRIDPAARRRDESPAAVILDCSGPDRVGALAEDLEGLPTAVIDHHHTAKNFGDVRYVRPEVAATCYLVQVIIESFGGAVTAEEAELLLFGICTDTGFFRHTEADAAPLFAAVSRLLAAGASPKTAFHQMSSGHELESRQLLGTLLRRAERLGDGRAVITWETRKDAIAYGRQNRDSDTLYQLLFGLEGVRLVGFLREENESLCTGSLRSFDTIDVSRIAELFGGGGHRRAAGFTTNLSLREVRRRVESEFIEALRADSGSSPG